METRFCRGSQRYTWVCRWINFVFFQSFFSWVLELWIAAHISDLFSDSYSWSGVVPIDLWFRHLECTVDQSNLTVVGGIKHHPTG